MAVVSVRGRWRAEGGGGEERRRGAGREGAGMRQDAQARHGAAQRHASKRARLTASGVQRGEDGSALESGRGATMRCRLACRVLAHASLRRTPQMRALLCTCARKVRATA
jgi:hypothetical protein